MSLLTRLVARATGRAAAGLTPRLPGRFETGSAGAEPPEVHGRTVAAPARAAEAVRREAPLPRTARHSEGPAPEGQETRAPAALSERSAPDLPEPLPPPAETPNAGRAEPRQAPEPPGPIVAAQAGHDTPEDREAARQHLPPGPPLRGPKPQRPAVERAPDVLLSEPPPFDRRRRPSDPGGEIRPPFRAPPVTRNRQTAAPEPPEITVHIGRIDVVMTPDERKGAKRAEPRPPRMTDLGDYLRGRETGG